MEDIRYSEGVLTLEPGDKIFQYTDGVTEATNAHNELYGKERLDAVLNGNSKRLPDEIIDAVKEDIDSFVDDAPQFDDITMLCLDMKELMIDAAIENIATVTAFIDEQLEQRDCPMKTKMQVHVAIDELFGNIAYYAYNPEIGIATVRVEVTDNPLAVVITFIDNGIPYDPLAKADPDITLSSEERDVGGLGIYMVKKTMDDISYEYKDGQNILRIKKLLL